ncbi:helix-turn-helix transcriptional regulator [Paenibacillus sp. FSL K6-1566]|uniref:helix-turn-helix domain-containing protein n=1 Tax=Paenibacillus sp. FSL K6-1566 TaxID=2954515 RepID=UPI0031018E22
MTITADTMFKLRKVYRLSQAEIGAMCGVSDAFINQIERGKRSLSDRIKHGLIREFELTPEKLARVLAIYEETTVITKGVS